MASNGDLYVGGSFTQAGGVAANHVAKWNGTTWSALGAGPANGLSTRRGDAVNALVVAGNGDLYVDGHFNQAGGAAANHVAKWNGTVWSALGTGAANGVNGGLTNVVLALAVTGTGDLYVGGDFTQAGGTVAANGVAKWNGTAWDALGTGAANGVSGRAFGYGFVYALAVVGNGDLYVGGDFNQAGGTAANRVAKWNGTAWSALGTGPANGIGSGIEDRVAALAVANNGDLYVGGDFNQAGGAAANRVAKWNGAAWSPLGTGLDNTVYALTVGTGGKVYAGGAFTAVGDGSKVSVRFGIYDPLAPLAAAAPARVTPLALAPNPAHGTAVLTLAPAAQARPVVVLDATGRVVRRHALPAHATAATLAVAGLAPGLYVVRCGAATGRLVVE